jgi:predicted O-methyltransferase YrrM
VRQEVPITLTASVVIPAWNAQGTLAQCLIAIEQSSFNRNLKESFVVSRETVMYLDNLPLQQASVGYGQLGTHSNLGYEGKSVQVRRQHYKHALSTHPPAHLTFNLAGRFGRFCCQVALNDDVPAGASHAEFSVIADGRLVTAAHVVAGAPPHTIEANIFGAHTLELKVSTSRWEYCHAVWLDPRVDELVVEASAEVLDDCLRRAEISLPAVMPRAERCIATVVSPGFEALLDDMLGSLYANGGCQDALLIVFALNANAACEQVVAKYRGLLIHCKACTRINATSKALLYSVARVVDAQRFLCLDADMLVLDDLNPVFAALEACPEGSILACREGNGKGFHNLEHALCTAYGGQVADIQRILGTAVGEGSYSLVVNDGLFAGSRSALLALDSAIRAMPGARAWTDEQHNIWWRNQFIFNLALARLQCGVELDAVYNLQLHVQDVQLAHVNGGIHAIWHGREVRVLHFSGVGRRKYPQWRNLFACVPDPLVGMGGGDGYTGFLHALRAWVGQRGLTALAWSFYGTTDAHTARVNDPGLLPLLATLHYLIRSNGCVRVVETGTARGVSAACLASAVAHRPEARVVTFDPYPHQQCTELWAGLPEAMHACIELRTTGSLEGMTTALRAAECYDAALLDSVHTEEHVWAEFQLAAQLVCTGGLILIHDVNYVHGTVEQALQRIEAAGYGVVRLWSAECGVCEDDRLGLAVIENRCKSYKQQINNTLS